ncbi:MAG TPA: RsfA family transcriptional regulator [Bacillales bacterium]
MLTASRQDAWNREEDLMLAEVVLRHIREGSTQLAAFEEIGERLSRTAAACGFRWNSLVRKKYQSAIALAKKQRKQLQQPASKSVSRNDEVVEEERITLEDVIAFLEKFRSTENGRENIKERNEVLLSQVSKLEEEKKRLQQEMNEVKKENRAIRNDYQALIEIMDRVRKQAALHGSNGEAKTIETDGISKAGE